jgi:hypothetical protein
MSSQDRRKARKAKKERLQAKKQAKRRERHPQMSGRGSGREQAQETLTAMVRDGRARIAMTSLDGLRQLLAVMWQPDGVQVHVCDVEDQAGMLAMAAAAKRQQVDDDEWHAFITDHMQVAISSGGRETQISLVEWKTGERSSAETSPAEPG